MFLLKPSLLGDDVVIFFFGRFVYLGKATSWVGGTPQPTWVGVWERGYRR